MRHGFRTLEAFIIAMLLVIFACFGIQIVLAAPPVVVITALYGSEGTAKLLVFSQVLLSMQLPFAVIPLVRFVTDREKMGRFVIPAWLASLAWVIAAIIVVLNVKLLVDTFVGG
jgi:manganese transport protein